MENPNVPPSKQCKYDTIVVLTINPTSPLVGFKILAKISQRAGEKLKPKLPEVRFGPKF